MRAYIAGRFGDRRRLRTERELIRALGIQCVCGWMDHAEDVASFSEDFDAAFCKQEKWRDLDDVRASDMLIFDNTGESGGKGRYVEMGYAIALGKTVYLVGPVDSVFTSDLERFTGYGNLHAHIRKLPDWPWRKEPDDAE